MEQEECYKAHVLPWWQTLLSMFTFQSCKYIF